MTERDRLAALVRTAGLRLSAADLETLLPAWQRYVALVDALRTELAIDPVSDGA